MKKPESKELKQSKIEKLVSKLTKTFEESLLSLLKSTKIGTGGKAAKLKIAANKLEESRVPSGYTVFMDVLKHIGRPAMTREIAGRIKMVHPELKLPKNKKILMQQLYNSASYLSKEGLINRTPVGKSSYEYSIKAAA